MKKLITLLVLLVFAVSSAAAEEPFNVSGSFSGVMRNVGWIYAEDTENTIPIVFTSDAGNVVISHTSGMSYSLKTVKPGDFVVVFSEIPDGLPNLSVSYTLPGDESGNVYTRMISKSGVDGSYIIMNDWYTEMAWTVAERLCSIASDEGFLSMYSSSYEILDFIEDIKPLLPESMPENHYFISVAWIDEVFEAGLAQEGIQMKPENREYYLNQFPATIISLAASQEGAVSLAASSILHANECMILPDIPFEPGLIVFDSGEGRVIIVSVSLAGEGIVNFRASTISRDVLEILTDMKEAAFEELAW